MTKYEEMPPNTIVKPGDRLTVTITVPESGGLTVRPGIDDVKLIERPISEELPTAPGYYERVRFPVSGGYFAIRLDEHGKWHREGMRVTEEQLRVSYLPLTRLVPETATAKLADRLDPKLVGALMDNISERDYDTYQEDGAVLIAAIDNGELDK